MIRFTMHRKFGRVEIWLYTYQRKIYDFTLDRTGASFDIGRISGGIGW